MSAAGQQTVQWRSAAQHSTRKKENSQPGSSSSRSFTTSHPNRARTLQFECLIGYLYERACDSSLTLLFFVSPFEWPAHHQNRGPRGRSQSAAHSDDETPTSQSVASRAERREGARGGRGWGAMRSGGLAMAEDLKRKERRTIRCAALLLGSLLQPLPTPLRSIGFAAPLVAAAHSPLSWDSCTLLAAIHLRVSSPFVAARAPSPPPAARRRRRCSSSARSLPLALLPPSLSVRLVWRHGHVAGHCQGDSRGRSQVHPAGARTGTGDRGAESRHRRTRSRPLDARRRTGSPRRQPRRRHAAAVVRVRGQAHSRRGIKGGDHTSAVCNACRASFPSSPILTAAAFLFVIACVCAVCWP